MPIINVIPHSEGPRKCPDGILNEYLKWSEETECHEDFHFWMGMSVISACMGRKYFFNMGFGSLFPNVYVILVGEAGLSGKSTAIGMAEKLYRASFLGNNPPIIAQKISPSKLIGELGRLQQENGEERAEGILINDELSALLGDTRKDDEILKVLTTLWDCKDDFELATRGRGREQIKNVCLSLWGGSTPTWLRGGIPDASLEGGFFSRLILVNRPRGGKRIALPFLNMNERFDEYFANLKNDLQRILSHRGGQFILSNEAAIKYMTWYEEELDKEVEEANLHMRGYYARKRTYVLKLAMILSISREDSLVIQTGDIIQALDLMERNEFFLKELVDYLGSSKEGQDLEFIKNKLLHLWKTKGKQVPGSPRRKIRHSDLLMSVSHRYSLMQVEQMITLLEQANFLSVVMQSKGRVYQTTPRSEGILGAGSQ